MSKILNKLGAIISNVFKMWRGKPIEFMPFQKDIIKCEVKNMNLVAGRRGSKTFTASYAFYNRILKDIKKNEEYKKLNNIEYEDEYSYDLIYWVVSPTYPMSKVTKEMILSIIPPEMIKRPYNKTDKSIVLHGNVLIEWKSASNPESLVGRSLNGLLLDETAKMKKEVVEYLLPSRDDKAGWLITSSTPEGMNFFFYDFVLNGNPIDATTTKEEYKSLPDWKNFYWTTRDNTSMPELVKAFEWAKAHLPRRQFLREYMAKMDIFSGQIYEEFDKSFSVQNILIETYNKKTKTVDYIENGEVKTYKFSKIFGFKDWGRTDAGVTLIAGLTEDRKHLVILHELYVTEEIPDYPNRDLPNQKNMLDLDFALYLRFGIDIFVTDNNQPNSIEAYRNRFEKLNVEVIKTKKSNISVSFGIMQVAKTIHVPEEELKDKDSKYKTYLQISIDCRNLLKEFPNYKYKDETQKPDPSCLDHALDSLRYGVVYVLDMLEDMRVEVNIIKDRNIINKKLWK